MEGDEKKLHKCSGTCGEMVEELHQKDPPLCETCYRREYYLKNKERDAEQRRNAKRKSYNKNKDEINRKRREKNKNRSEEEKEAKKKYNKDYGEKNKEKLRVQSKKYYEENKDKNVEYRKEYRKKNKEKRRNFLNKKYNNDENFRMAQLLRVSVSRAFRNFSQTGKIQATNKYGIDIEAIIEHLGPSPEPREQYHIDHVFPVCAFNLDNLQHILACFAPENHQWLTVEENLIKSGKYNQQEFEEYLKKFTKGKEET